MINNPVAPALSNSASFGVLIGNLISMGIIIASVLVLLYLVLGGIEWITSGGDKAGLENARNRIINALIGLGIVVSAWAVMAVISTFLGLSFPCLPIPTLSGIKSTCAVTGGGGTCPAGNAGQPGENCSDLNKCDIAGGCNPACGAHTTTCSNGKIYDIPNGYCRSQYSSKDCVGSGSCTIKSGSCTNSTTCPNLCVCEFGNCRSSGCGGLSDSACAAHGVACNWNGSQCVPK